MGVTIIYEIEEIKGVGNKLVKKIIKEYGSYEEFVKSVENYEIDQLMNIQGISQKLALEIIRKVHNHENSSFLKTEQSKKIYDEEIVKLLPGAYKWPSCP